jgi:predicted dithiol-disulfide oxidoreductase (DUF899 family)
MALDGDGVRKWGIDLRRFRHRESSGSSHEEWLAARTALLAKEREFTRLRDELTEQRRALPWEAVTKEYVFDGASGKQTLPELDIVPKGRDEGGRGPFWVRRHDEYGLSK